MSLFYFDKSCGRKFRVDVSKHRFTCFPHQCHLLFGCVGRNRINNDASCDKAIYADHEQKNADHVKWFIMPVEDYSRVFSDVEANQFNSAREILHIFLEPGFRWWHT